MKSFFLALLGALLLAGIPAVASSPATITTLAVTSGNSAVTTVPLGSVVMLTATVKTGSTAVTVGEVNFCDATAAHCTDIHLLSTAQLTKDGTASFKFRPAAGSHSYKAVFVGTSQVAASTSSSEVLQATGISWSVTEFPAPTGNNGNYTLIATVQGNGGMAPTGTVSFLETGAGNAVLGTATLVAGAQGVRFPSGTSTFASNGVSPTSVAVGDFNGDGFLDLAVADGSSNLTIYLGDANGNLGFGQVIPNAGTKVIAGDFNGDGILDLVSGTTVFQGNGNGTFWAESSLPAGSSYLAAADLNGDGILDLVSGTALHPGNGDGTFKAAMNLPTSGDFVAVADFNGDGIPDLAVSSISGKSVTLLLGNGDGTFSVRATNLQDGRSPGPMAVADLTVDGFQDLVIANDDGTLTVQLNDGKGNFTSIPNGVDVEPGVGAIWPITAVEITDLNGDGVPDLAVARPYAISGQAAGSAMVLLGNGKGDFPTSAVAGGGTPDGMAIGDFNGDGIPDVVVASPGQTEGVYVDVSFAATQNATATAAGIQLAAGTGTQPVVASYPGDSNYMSSVSTVQDLLGPKSTPTIVVTASVKTAVFGTSVTFWATVSGSGPTPTGTVMLEGNGTMSAPLDSKGVAGGFVRNDLPGGSDTLVAFYSGDSYYQNGTSPPFTITITQTTPTMTVVPEFPIITDLMGESVSVTVGGGLNVPSGTGTLSGGAYTATTTLNGGLATFTIAPGTLSKGANTLTATYSGDSNFMGTSATTSITVAPVAMNVPPQNDLQPGAGFTTSVALSAGSTYSGTMNLTCTLTSSPSGAQKLPTCSLSPTSVTLTSSGNGTSALTVSTTAAATASLVRPFGGNMWGLGGGGTVLAAAVLMLGIPSRRRRWFPMLVLLCVIAAAGIIACGGGGGSSTTLPPITPGTTRGNYTFTLTGTDSANTTITTSTIVQITVL